MEALFAASQQINDPASPDMRAGASAVGKEAGLKYVYSGNLPGDENEHTYCPSCGKRVIERFGFMVGRREIRDGACRFCDTPIDGVGM